MHQEEANPSKFWTSLPVILLGLVALAIITVVGYMTWQDRKSDPIIDTTATSVSVDGAITQTTSSTKKELRILFFNKYDNHFNNTRREKDGDYGW